ncbi:hypothetical protein [Acinetobacter populi]|uniref:Uncharacterized protein n=1 Tax=Acinetobacter populi TaxID=1582270 RepID=A0A1Z9YUI1_9GAMM|nr:hypothetical protein [Acinetobacter populi]OUY05870.1 hypothetical protein CAP51_14195 [Acinetobacter populi]
MSRNELINFLKLLGVHESSYSFDIIKNSECVSVLEDNSEWRVYYTERDKPDLLFSSFSEEIAYDFVANLFKKWLDKN